MEKTKTRRAPERPTAATAPAETAAQEKVISKPKKRVIKRAVKDVFHCEYEIVNGGGIVFILPQKGVTIYDSEKDTVREVRYCPNEPSIYVDEQSKNALKQSVAFREGRLFVPKEKPNLRKFLDSHPSNTANGGTTFVKIDKKEDAKKELEKEFLLTDAITIVRDREINDLLPIAMYFGVDINASVSDIRYSLLRIAKTKTKEFLESLDSPQVSCRSTVQQAADYQILNVKNNGVYWFDSNQLIISVPVGQDAVDTMVRFCLTEKGASALSLIEERLDKLA
tara:strand:- start:29836 stop:30678 length:843 start_codon:yes stop_codon:yes gene_type:complete